MQFHQARLSVGPLINLVASLQSFALVTYMEVPLAVEKHWHCLFSGFSSNTEPQ